MNKWAPIIYYLLLLLSLVVADPEQPRSIFYYNELMFLPLVVLLTTLFFQREFGGGSMEIFATFPISFTGMVVRKISWIISVSLVLHLGWYLVYIYKFSYGNTPAYSQLLIRSVPEYLVMIGVVIFGMVIGKRLYTGMLAGFTLWMIEALSQGKILGSFTLLSIYIPKEMTLYQNRLYLLIIGLLLYIGAIMVINRRQRWIVDDEFE